MPERWIIYRLSGVKGNLSFYVGKFRNNKRDYIIFRRKADVDYPQWSSRLEDKDVIVFGSYKEAVKEKKTLFLSRSGGYKYGIDMHPKDRYG
jgi:hypothetical protein